MRTLQQTSKEYFKGINIIYFAIISGILIFMSIAVFLNSINSFATDDAFTVKIITIILLVLLSAGLLGSQLLFNKKLKQIKEQKKDLLAKTAEYRSTLITRYVFIEAPGFFSVIGYLLTGSNIFVILVGITVGILIILRPTREKLITDLQLDITEKEKIYDPDAVISEAILQDSNSFS